MNFKPDEKNIRSLLKSGCQFVIPKISEGIFLGQKELSRIL